jgi:metal-responsive CopG/Arc/MetJ family transcriptional regulator
MEKIARVSAGVKFESDVLTFIDGLARENQRSRSFIVNAIIRWYLRQHKELTKVESDEKVPVIRL